MHEVSIIISAMEIILEKAKENNLKRVDRITFKVGGLSGVMDEALYFAFESVSEGTIAEGSTLVIEKVKPTARCGGCNMEFEIDHYNKLCPECGLFSTDILTGYELYINTIEGD